MNMNHVVLGYEGKVEMLRACYGSKDDNKTKKKKPTAADVKFFAATHNAVMSKGKKT